MEQIARSAKQIGTVVSRGRRRMKLSQAELGSEAGSLRQATVSALENGASDTKLQTLLDVLSALGLEMVIRERSKADKKIEDTF